LVNKGTSEVSYASKAVPKSIEETKLLGEKEEIKADGGITPFSLDNNLASTVSPDVLRHQQSSILMQMTVISDLQLTVVSQSEPIPLASGRPRRAAAMGKASIGAKK